jgi:hypothetical protein
LRSYTIQEAFIESQAVREIREEGGRVKSGAVLNRSVVGTVAAFLMLCGCVSSKERWDAVGVDWFKRGASRDEFLRDKARCEAETAAAVEQQAEADWTAATTQGVGNCLYGLGYRPWGERDVYDRARETVPMR